MHKVDEIGFHLSIAHEANAMTLDFLLVLEPKSLLVIWNIEEDNVAG